MFDGHATFIDPHTIEVGGKRVTAANIVIATGGHPERPDIPGAELGIISDTVDSGRLERTMLRPDPGDGVR